MAHLTQHLTALSEATAHLTFPFPFTFGKNTAHKCWVQTGNLNPKISKRTSFKQHYWYTTWDNDKKAWLPIKSKFAADIILLYTPNDPTNISFGLPQVITVDFDSGTDGIYDFINFARCSNLYFNQIQRQLIFNKLLTTGETLEKHVLWQEPTDPAIQAQLNQANLALNHLQIGHKLEKQSTKLLSETSEARLSTNQNKFFRLYTIGDYRRERADNPGWDCPQDLKDRDLHDLDKNWESIQFVRDLTLERWAKRDAIYTHWNNLPALLQALPNLHPNEILRLAAIYEEVTGETMPIPQPA